MATEVAMPKLGLLMTEGVVVKWLIADGQPVEQGQPIVHIMTKKITYQVVAPAGGILHHVAQIDERVLIGAPLAVIVAPGEQAPAPPHGAAQTPTAGTASPALPAGDAAHDGFVPASPWARHLAHQLSVELAYVHGTGPDGCIIGRDVLRFSEQRRQTPGGKRTARPAPLIQPSARVRTIPFAGMRKMIAQRMTESLHTMAPATLTAEVDVTALLKLRKQTSARPHPTHTDLVIKAVAIALKAHPQLNAVLLGDEIELLEEIHVGIAVPLEDGLLVPVVRHADRLTVGAIAQETRRLARSARSDKLTVDDVAGSTFTVTDLGVYGVDFFVPIINPPEAAILGIGRIIERPVILRGEVVARSMMMLCLTFDHRVVDGVPAAAFLHAVSGLLAKPRRLFTEEG
jgi:pyruvate dehydrogenase E2 component (dihydrolipoamide acetyltransferase)